MERSPRGSQERANQPGTSASSSRSFGISPQPGSVEGLPEQLPVTPTTLVSNFTAQMSPQERQLRHKVLTFVLHYLHRCAHIPGKWDVQTLTQNAHGLFYTPWSSAETLRILSSTVALPMEAPLSEKPVEQRGSHNGVYVRDGIPAVALTPPGVFLWRHPSPSDMAPFLCDVIRLFPRNRAANVRVFAAAARRQLPVAVSWTEEEIIRALTGSPSMPGLVLEDPEKTPIYTRIQIGKPFRRWIYDVVELAEERYHENADACHFYFRDISSLERFEIKVRAPWDSRDDRGIVWMHATFVLEQDKQVQARLTMPSKQGSYNLARTLTRETPHGLVFLYTTQPRTTLPLWGMWLCLRGRVHKEGVHARVVLCMSGLIRNFECPFSGAKLYVLQGQAPDDVYKACESLTVNPNMRLHEHARASWVALAGQTYVPGTQLEGEVGQPCWPQGVLFGRPLQSPHYELQRRCHFLYYDSVLTKDAPLPLLCPFAPSTMITDTGVPIVKDLVLVNTSHTTTHLMLVCRWSSWEPQPDIRMGLLFRMRRPRSPHGWELQCILPESGEGYAVGQGRLLAARSLFPFAAFLCLFMVETTVSGADRRQCAKRLRTLATAGVCPPIAMVHSLMALEAEEEAGRPEHDIVFEPDPLDLGLSCLMKRFPARYEIIAGVYCDLTPLIPWLTATTTTPVQTLSAGANVYRVVSQLVNMDLYVGHLSVGSFRRHAQGQVYLMDPSPLTFLATDETLHLRKTLVFYLNEVGVADARGRRRQISADAAYELAQRFECLCMCCGVACSSTSSLERCQSTERAFIEAVLPLEFLSGLSTEAPRLYHEFLWCLDHPGMVHQVLYASEGTVFANFFARYCCDLRQNVAAVRAVKRRLEDGAGDEARVAHAARPRVVARSHTW